MKHTAAAIDHTQHQPARDTAAVVPPQLFKATILNLRHNLQEELLQEACEAVYRCFDSNTSPVLRDLALGEVLNSPFGETVAKELANNAIDPIVRANALCSLVAIQTREGRAEEVEGTIHALMRHTIGHNLTALMVEAYTVQALHLLPESIAKGSALCRNTYGIPH